MAGFNWRYSLSGGISAVAEFRAKDTETLTKGDLMNVETGEVDLAATNDTGFAGALIGAAPVSIDAEASPGVITAVDSTTWLRVYIDPYAVYGVTDANARNAGASLDIAGATGAQTVAASSNVDVVVVETKKAAADETLVMIFGADHYLVP